MFHRALGPTPPRDTELPAEPPQGFKIQTLCSSVQVQCGDLELDKEINDRVTEFCAHLHTTRETSGQVIPSVTSLRHID